LWEGTFCLFTHTTVEKCANRHQAEKSSENFWNGPLRTLASDIDCCGAARRSGHSFCLQMPFNIHALMENSDDGDLFG